MAAPSAPGLPPHLAEPGDGARRILGDGAEEELPLFIGYPVIPDTVEGQPVYAFLPSAPPRQWWRRIHRRRSCFPSSSSSSSSSSCFFFLAFLLLLAGALAFFAWPRSIRTSSFDLDLQKIRFSIDRSDASFVSFDLDLDLSFQARNPNFLQFVYSDVVSIVSFQGLAIGDSQVSDGGSIDALDTDSVDASLEIDGFEISSNVSVLVSDIAKGSVPLRITSAFDGYIDLFLFQLPVEGKVICDIVVDPDSQALRSQDCS